MKTKAYTIRLTPEQEDRVLIHAARRQIKRPTTMVQVMFDSGLVLLDGMLKEEEEKKE